jgi:hypothetical protein
VPVCSVVSCVDVDTALIHSGMVNCCYGCYAGCYIFWYFYYCFHMSDG